MRLLHFRSPKVLQGKMEHKDRKVLKGFQGLQDQQVLQEGMDTMVVTQLVTTKRSMSNPPRSQLFLEGL
jgi:hypothetical protein